MLYLVIGACAIGFVGAEIFNRFVKNKSPNKPIFNHKERISVLKSLKFFSKVVLSENETAVENIKKYRPNLYFKGLDYKIEKDRYKIYRYLGILLGIQ